MTNLSNTPPQSMEAERAVLGAILKDPMVLVDVSTIITGPKVFYHPKHRMIYEAISALAIENEPTDITLVSDELSKAGNLDKVGGRVYLVDIMEDCTTPSNAPWHAKVVIEYYKHRQLIKLCNDTIDKAHSQDEPFDALASRLESDVGSLSDDDRMSSGPVAVGDLKDEIVASANQYLNDTIDSIRTGWIDFDRAIEILPQDLIIIAGRPSMGKTALALCMTIKYAKAGRPVAFFTLEGSKKKLGRRIVCNLSKVSFQSIRNRTITEDEMIRFRSCSDKLTDLPIFIDDRGDMSIDMIRSQARQMVSRHGVQVIIVDYLQLISAHAENRNLEITAISRGLRNMAKELNVPVIALAQLNRGVELRANKRPLVADLRDSGSIEQDADIVIFPFREAQYIQNPSEKMENTVEIHVAKNKEAPTTTFPMHFYGEHTTFDDRAPEHYYHNMEVV